MAVSIEIAAEIVLAQLRQENSEINEATIIAKTKSLGFNQEEAEDVAEKILWLDLE